MEDWRNQLLNRKGTKLTDEESLSKVQQEINNLADNMRKAEQIEKIIKDNIEYSNQSLLVWYYLRGLFFVRLKYQAERENARAEEIELYRKLYFNDQQRTNYNSTVVAATIVKYPSLIYLKVAIRKFLMGMRYIKQLEIEDPYNEDLRLFSTPVDFVIISSKNLPVVDRVYIK